MSNSNIINPWKGLEFYTYDDSSHFFGREDETKKLADTVAQNSLTILYGPSGVGKSSLINAGLRPFIEKKNYFFVYIRSIDYSVSTDGIISQIIEKIKEEALAQNVDITPIVKSNNETLKSSLWFFLKAQEFWSESNQLLVPLVVIDQFEEIFTKSDSDISIQEFLQEIDNLTSVLPPLYIRTILEDENIDLDNSLGIRFVFSLREDFVPRLDDYVYELDIDELKKSRFSISLMTKEQATSVIEKPNREIIGDGVTDAVLSILTAKTSILNRRKQIEPFLLSLFMYRLYIKTKERSQEKITTDVVNAFGPNIVADYYKESMDKISTKALFYLEDTLLTSNGYRDSVSLDKLLNSKRITEKEISSLLKTRIIKKDCINDVERIEFTHDVLAVVAKTNRDRRRNSKRLRKALGFIGLSLSILLCIVSCWKLSFILSSISIITILPIASLSLYSLKGGKNSFRDIRNIAILNLLAGALIVITQLSCNNSIILLVIYELLGALAAFELYKHFFGKDSLILNVLKCLVFWVLLYNILANVSLGYNQFSGLQFARDVNFSNSEFYIKDSSGYLGLRNRFDILAEPRYDDYLRRNNTDFIFSHDSLYGVINKDYETIMEPLYDSIHIENGMMFPYLSGREMFDNGMSAKWESSIRPTQKEIIRGIINNMVFIEGGSFVMGRSKYDEAFEEHPVNSENLVHTVKLSDYYMDRFELTMEEWISIMNFNPCDNGCETKTISDNCPVHNITFEDCLHFVSKINRLSDIKFSLPTEARWEYAARGGNKSKGFKYAGANNPTDCGWLVKNSDYSIHPVGELIPNELGLYDMTGNIAEWCLDYMSDSFYRESNNSEDPICTKPTKGNKRIFRGSAYDSRNTNNYRTTSRQYTDAGQIKYTRIGIRLVAEESE